ncbi:MAG: molybdate ABC transporter substrate-binding protein [Holophagales bacterium]|jgi:molybdate transport system substrate-binding protein|nr:molybdate ABC transporter substrate-binding protein [Holophagales bacterium]
MRRVSFLPSILAVIRLCAPAPVLSEALTREVRVAAAADLEFALDAVFAATAASTGGIRPAVTYGSSGSFYAQIENGAPYDLFLSADADYPRRLAAKGLADGEPFLYAVGRIALWVPASSKVDIEGLGLRALLEPSILKIAIANPRHAPYGRAAEAAMKSLGVYDGVKEKLVLGENVAQAAQFVESGAAEAGVIALSLALAPRMRSAGRHVELPTGSYPRMDQGGLVLKGARDPAAARTLRDALLGPRGRELLKEHGFTLPAAAPAP